MAVFGQFIGWVVVTIFAIGATVGCYGYAMMCGGQKIGLEGIIILVIVGALWTISIKIAPFALVAA